MDMVCLEPCGVVFDSLGSNHVMFSVSTGLDSGEYSFGLLYTVGG